MRKINYVVSYGRVARVAEHILYLYVVQIGYP